MTAIEIYQDGRLLAEANVEVVPREGEYLRIPYQRIPGATNYRVEQVVHPFVYIGKTLVPKSAVQVYITSF